MMGLLVRCTECRQEIPKPMLSQLSGCPNCGGAEVYDSSFDLQLIGPNGNWTPINWGELRLLTHFAWFWADWRCHTAENDQEREAGRRMLRIVDAVAQGIKPLNPDSALTMADDVAKDRAAGRKVRMTRPDGTEVLSEPSFLNSGRVAPENNPREESALDFFLRNLESK